MGSSGSSTYKKVSAADTLSLSDIYDEANDAASEQLQDRIDAIKSNYSDIANLQLDTVNTVAGVLSGTDDYAASKSALQKASAAVDDMKTGETRISDLADSVSGAADEAFRNRGATSIEAELYRQGESDLALGRSLSAEQIRAAQQAARSAYGSRGLGTSAAGAAAEILNRDAYAQNREDARRNFAAYANNLRESNIRTRTDQAAALAGQAGNLSSNQSAIAGNRATLQTNISSGYTDINPYRYALATSSPYTTSTLSAISDTTNSTYDQATDTSSNVASFNANMIDTRYNNYLNNTAATSAANTAATASLASSGISALGNILSDRREKTAIKEVDSSLGGLLGLNTYQYRLKGDDKKRIGFMAQDVKRVLPSAVGEKMINGKKRLFIKPRVIGAALAAELEQQS